MKNTLVNISLGKNHLCLTAADIVSIKVDDNDCYIFVLQDNGTLNQKPHAVRGTLSYFAEMVPKILVAANRSMIINLLQLKEIKGNFMYLRHLKEPVEVTASRWQTMSVALKDVLGIEHRFGKLTSKNGPSTP